MVSGQQARSGFCRRFESVVWITRRYANKARRVDKQGRKSGLRINVKKTKALTINTSKTDPFTLRDESIEDVDSFTYLGSVAATDGGAVQDFSQRIRQANGAFVQLYPVWKNSRISIRSKLRIFSSNVKSVLLFGSETGKEIKTNISNPQTFVNRCLRRILEHPLPGSDFKWRTLEKDRRNRDVHADQETEVEMDRTFTEERKWSHRKREALDWNLQGKRRRGRPRHAWRRTVHNEAVAKGKNWNEVKRMAGNRTR